jgi:hypothetical protein
MEKSATDDNARTAPLKPRLYKIITMGSIPVTDSDFLSWREQHFPSLATRDAMLLHVRDLNGQNKIRFQQEMEQWKTYMRSRLPPQQKKELEGLMTRNDGLTAWISELNALHGTLLMQAVVLTPQNTSQNILSLQVASTPQNIPPPPEQSSPQNHSAPPSLEQPLSLNVPPPSGKQMTDPPVAEQPYVLGSLRRTSSQPMQQALDLFELRQENRRRQRNP